jgi:hypothetical protein
MQGKGTDHTFHGANRIMNGHPEFFVGWGTLSLINAGLAQSKGRSGLLWWLASLFFGPVATLLIVVLPKLASVPGNGQSAVPSP